MKHSKANKKIYIIKEQPITNSYFYPVLPIGSTVKMSGEIEYLYEEVYFIVTAHLIEGKIISSMMIPLHSIHGGADSRRTIRTSCRRIDYKVLSIPGYDEWEYEKV